VNVDMATYKAEFLSHYYEGRPRPRTAYAMGFIHRWARLGAYAPQVVNLVTQMPGLSHLAKALGGISQHRSIPRFADQTFVAWFRSRPARKVTGERRRVLLWPDTFNNHFHPRTAIAATEALEAAGCDVTIPAASLCCGRPLYDYGFLSTAKRLLRQILDALGPHLEAGTPIVVLEPSCLAVFHDELTNLFPDDARAQRLAKQSFLLADFLRTKVPDYRPPRLRRAAMVHGHCHHKAIVGLDAEEAMLKDMTDDLQVVDSGCCGMAGSFGFEADHYDVSQQIGELVLLPAVRQAPADTLLVADGFSCREQIWQATGREAMHFAEVLRAATRNLSSS
jgi:Fe-S oxidoreductase